jgi:hypothetical protein
MKKITLNKNGSKFDERFAEDADADAKVSEFNEKFVNGDSSFEVVVSDPSNEELLMICHAKRASAYPSLGDQLDATFKARAGDSTQLAAIDASIASVKTTFPKPTQQ